MQVDYPNLKVSINGWYSYRRAIPKRLRWLFNERLEYKVSFKTKDKKQAVQKWHEQERLWERTKSLSQNLEIDRDKLSLAELQQQADTLRELWNITDSDLAGMETQHRDEVQIEASSLLQELLLDETKRNENYKAGMGVTSPTRPISRNAHELALLDISGLNFIKIPVTFMDILDHYLKEIGPTKRDEVTRVKFIKSTKSIFFKVAGLMPLGLSTEVASLSTNDASKDRLRLGLKELWPNGGTRKRNLVPLKASISTWNEFHTEKLPETLFSGMVSKREINDSKTERRSFTPKEYKLFFANVAANISDEEVILFLRIMAETGARNNEVTSLELNDVKPKSKTPHLIFRGNKIRGLSKNGLERAVPISLETADAIIRFVGDDSSRNPLFQFYSNQHKGADLSKLCSDQIVNLRPYDKRLLTPYSLRHTFTDKLRKVGARDDVALYLTGHKSAGSSRIHEKYGTAVPPNVLAKLVAEAREAKDWGYFEETDW